VREFLLTHNVVEVNHPGGKWISVLGATDGEIATAVQNFYGKSISFNISKLIVYKERRRLEVCYGVPVEDYEGFYLKATNKYGRRLSKSQRARKHKQLLKIALSRYYEPFDVAPVHPPVVTKKP